VLNFGWHSLTYGKHIPEAEQVFRKTLDMDPNFPISHYGYAQVLILQKKFDEAVNEMEKLFQSVPESSYYRGLSRICLCQGRQDRASAKNSREFGIERNQKQSTSLGWESQTSTGPG